MTPTWSPYAGDAYLDYRALCAWMASLEQALPRWFRMERAGTSGQGRPIWLMRVGDAEGGDPLHRPTFWLDGGTHASEFTGVMAALFALSRWAEALSGGDAATCAWFAHNTVAAIPCVSPDGYDALYNGHPFVRSSLRPAPDGTPRVGFEAQDLDGDGIVRQMRWRHPAGPVVEDEDEPLFMRPRRIDDDPARAFFLASEGHFIHWDGVRWVQAPLRYGIDLNRNFSSGWAPFTMFGMDAGAFALSEPESRATTDAFHAHPHVGAAVTLHTYTGCILTQPYRADSPLTPPDQDLMEALAEDSVQGTPWKVYKVHPDFTYDPKQPIVGVWADTISTVFGVPGYTLELWDPYAQAGVSIDNPARLFRKPDPAIHKALIREFAKPSYAPKAWTPFQHPQLGEVEIGGIDYMRTVRNPPEALLSASCEHAFTIIERVRKALPRVTLTPELVEVAPGLARLDVVVENFGFLPTSGLAHGERVQATPGASLELELTGGATLSEGAPGLVAVGHLDGWGTARVGASRSALYPSLPARGNRARARWWIKTDAAAPDAQARVRWTMGRAGRGALEVALRPADAQDAEG